MIRRTITIEVWSVTMYMTVSAYLLNVREPHKATVDLSRAGINPDRFVFVLNVSPERHERIADFVESARGQCQYSITVQEW